MRRELRRARPEELDAVYAMGYDAWGEGAELPRYLEACRASARYRSGRWHVLCEVGVPAASALVHDLPSWGGLTLRGLGSVAVPRERRGQGLATELVDRLARCLESDDGASVLLLHSDIGPALYARLGFAPLDSSRQRRPGTVLMARLAPGVPPGLLSDPSFPVPPYF